MSKHIRISPEEAADRLAIRELVEAYAHCAEALLKNPRAIIKIDCAEASDRHVHSQPPLNPASCKPLTMYGQSASIATISRYDSFRSLR